MQAREYMERLNEIMFSAVPQGPLYHYTSLDSLVSIFSSKNMRATDVRYVNDAQEIKYFAEQFKLTVRRFECSGEDAVIQRQLEKWIEDRLVSEWSRMVFCVSFSEESDLLSQWRAYAPHWPAPQQWSTRFVSPAVSR